MATSVQIPIAEYLKTSYRPDREYIDGEVVERNLATWEHGRVQILVGIWFGAHESEWGVMVASEWRARVSPTRVRIPDVTVVLAGPQPPVLEQAPLLAIESSRRTTPTPPPSASAWTTPAWASTPSG